MTRPRVMILRAAGTNCDLEAEYAWNLAGAAAERVHVRRAVDSPALLRDFQVLTIPGGFSYGDDLGAGKIFAVQIQRHLIGAVREFVERGGLVLGICNGFQVLAKAGLLPDPSADAQRCTVTYNEPAGFQDRWVTLRAEQSPCVFTEPGRVYEMPIGHGEGRVVFASGAVSAEVAENRQGALVYVAAPPGFGQDGMPANPNGSTADIAGLCDASGRVLGLMPHPERFITWTQHPCWTSLPPREHGDGLALFQRAVAYLR